MSDEVFKKIIDEFDFEIKDAALYNPLVLAYIGDAVYEVYIRTLLISKSNKSVHSLHKYSIEYVNAKAQSSIVHRIHDKLTLEEQNILRRGRNARSGTIPKNANITEYKYATGFEALIGYLYLKKEIDRLIEILKIAVLEVETKD